MTSPISKEDRHHTHTWIPFYYEVVYVGDGKNVNYVLKSVYCHHCGVNEDTKVEERNKEK